GQFQLDFPPRFAHESCVLLAAPLSVRAFAAALARLRRDRRRAATMPSADFCTALARLAARAVRFGPKDPHGTRCRPPEVSLTAFRTPPPEFTQSALDGYGLRVTLPARPTPHASYPVLVHWLVRLLALPSDPISRWQPLRFAILPLHQVGAGTLTPPAVKHARHTG